MKKIALVLAICVFIHAEEILQTTQTQNAINQTQDIRQEQNGNENQETKTDEKKQKLQKFSKESTFNWLIGAGFFQGLGYWEHLRGGG